MTLGPETSTSEIRQELLLALRSRHITQRQLARELGVTESRLSLYFRGKSDVRAQLLVRMLKAAGLDVEALLAEGRLGLAPARARGISGQAAQIGRLVDELPPEERRVLFQYVLRYHHAFSGRAQRGLG